MSGEIFRIGKDKIRAKFIFELAKERYDLIGTIPKDKTFKIVEELYETIKELILSLMYLDGFKTWSHIKMIEYLADNYKQFDNSEIKVMDDLRKIRQGTMYYGDKVNESFLLNYKKKIELIVSKMFKFVEGELGSEK